MKKVILVVFVAVVAHVFAADRKKSNFRDPDRVWTSIGANHEPVAAFEELGYRFLICKPKHPTLPDVPVVFCDPTIDIVKSDPVVATSSSFRVAISTANGSKTFTMSNTNLNRNFRYHRLERSVLETEAAKWKK